VAAALTAWSSRASTTQHPDLGDIQANFPRPNVVGKVS